MAGFADQSGIAFAGSEGMIAKPKKRTADNLRATSFRRGVINMQVGNQC
jgi:hypothetical protein